MVTNENIIWLIETRAYNFLWIPNIGNKKDLRDDPAFVKDCKLKGKKLVKTDEGDTMAKRIKAYCFIECSSKTREGVKQVFEQAARASLQVQDNSTNKKRCIVL